MKKLMRPCCLVLSIGLMLTTVGCREDRLPESTLPATQSVSTAGMGFLSSGFKIRSEMKPKSSVSADPLIFEVYVDGDGDGAGLVGYKDTVYDVYMVANQVYVTISDESVVHVSDLLSHMIPSDVNVTSAVDLKSLGFAVLDNNVVSYMGGTDTMDIVSKYETSASVFEPVAISQSNNMTLDELIKYFSDKTSTDFVEPSAEVSESLDPQSFYVNSALGITVRDVVYSLGDYCNPYTYFESSVPAGITTREEYKEDEKVVFTYVFYISSDGNSTFMTTEGYVQAITTTSDFTFLDVIKRGMSDEELAKLLGVGLKKDELEQFRPIREDMSAVKAKSGYTVTIGDITAELEIDKTTRTLAAITITNYLEFRS